MKPAMAALLLALALLFGPIQPASAHRPSDAFLTLDVAERTITGQWDIALRDLEHAIGLDSDQDGAVTWGELKGQHEAIAAYALSRLAITTGAGVCPTRIAEHLVDRHDGAAYAIVRFTADCPAAVQALDLTYNLLFDLDALHHGLVRVSHAGQTHTTTFSPQRRDWRIEAGTPDRLRQVTTYLAEGIWHIWIGFDHILFLISLLLPAVLRPDGRNRRPVPRLHAAFVDVAKVVTAFTVAHSATLALAATGWLSLPSRLVEPVIAATIIVAAANNLYPLITRRIWIMAFGFGLIHGVGFAAALQQLGLPAGAFLVSLISFNIGVELGQLVIVAAVLPAGLLLWRSPRYARGVLQFGSLVIAAVAGLWLVERTFGVALIG